MPSNTRKDELSPVLNDLADEATVVVDPDRPTLCPVLVVKESEGCNAPFLLPTIAAFDETAFSDCRMDTFWRSAMPTAL